jgi:DNA-binding NtrC family response regulator
MSKKTILIVDDEESIRESISQILIIKGYSVLSAENGLEAFELVKKEPIDFIISDIRMPKCDGATLLELVKKHNPHIPMILITGYSDISVEDLLKKGANSVIVKPFRIQNLLRTIEEALVA